ncbi:hypothetical protein FB451DRAFT_1164042 [Mycena latifolia]|nr:hypothetical protein FB451DRAFT_1164042 [Mycena latifolia]
MVLPARILTKLSVFMSAVARLAALGRGISQDNWIDRVRYLHQIGGGSSGPAGSFLDSHFQEIHLFDTMCERIVTTFSATLERYQNLSTGAYHCIISNTLRQTFYGQKFNHGTGTHSSALGDIVGRGECLAGKYPNRGKPIERADEAEMKGRVCNDKCDSKTLEFLAPGSTADRLGSFPVL